MKPIQTDQAPQAIGPYSQAILANGMVFCSGQISFNNKGQLVGETIEQQTHQVMKNLEEVLKESGSGFSQVVKTTIFLKNMNDFQKMNEVYASYLNEPYPARSTVQAARLPKDVLVEIEMIAVVI